MSQIVLSPNNAGTAQYTIAAPGTSTNRTLTLPDATTTLVGTDATQTLTNKTIQGGALTLATAQASTSGTFIDFTGIPSWVKRITVMFNNVSLSGTAAFLIQLGDAGGVEATSYVSLSTVAASTVVTTTSTAGFIISGSGGLTAARGYQGIMQICLLGSNTWTEGGNFNDGVGNTFTSSGAKTLSDTLTQVRVTTTNGTDTFDAGSINIMYEG